MLCKCGEEQSTEDLVKDAESLLKEVYEEQGGSSWWLRKDMILVLQCVFRRLRVLSGQMTCWLIGLDPTDPTAWKTSYAWQRCQAPQAAHQPSRNSFKGPCAISFPRSSYWISCIFFPKMGNQMCHILGDETSPLEIAIVGCRLVVGVFPLPHDWATLVSCWCRSCQAVMAKQTQEGEELRVLVGR